MHRTGLGVHVWFLCAISSTRGTALYNVPKGGSTQTSRQADVAPHPLYPHVAAHTAQRQPYCPVQALILGVGADGRNPLACRCWRLGSPTEMLGGVSEGVQREGESSGELRQTVYFIIAMYVIQFLRITACNKVELA